MEKFQSSLYFKKPIQIAKSEFKNGCIALEKVLLKYRTTLFALAGLALAKLMFSNNVKDKLLSENNPEIKVQ